MSSSTVKFRVLRARGEGASTEVVPCIEGRCREGDRVLAVIEPCDRSHYSLVLINEGRTGVAISGKDAEVGGEQIVHSLVLMHTDGSEWHLRSGAKIIAVFADAPIGDQIASACALADDFRPNGVEVEVVTLSFDV